MDTLKRGGSAADAAVAASLMLGVTAPVSSGLGGGGFAMVLDAATGKTFCLDFRETSPAHFDPVAFAKSRKDEARATAGQAVGVPGEAAGLGELHRRWGKLSFGEDVGPALAAAESGYTVTRHLARSLRAMKETAGIGEARALFAPLGDWAKEGERLTQPRLAGTLRKLAEQGAKGFYQGEVAADLARAAKANGGALTVDDLARYAVVERTPLRGEWEGYQVATMPAPSAGGLMLLQTLRMFSKAELVAMGEASAHLAHMLAEAMRGSLADRMRYVGDPAVVPDRAKALLDPARMASRKQALAYDRTHVPPRASLEEHGTSHLVVADARGNVVSLTTTVNSPFGAKIWGESSGVLLNDQLNDFTQKELADAFGVGEPPNAARAGVRPVSSMTPTIVTQAGAPVLALGGSGGLRIAGNVTQVALLALAFDRSATAAVSAPRFFVPPRGPSLSYGAGQLPERSVVLDLMDRGEQISESGPDLTAVQAIRWDRVTNDVEAAGDPRKGGAAAVE